MSNVTPARLARLLPWAGIAALAVLVYLPALQGEILGWDDAEIITHNYRIQYLSADTLLDIFRPVSRYGKPPFALYVPLTELSIACEYHLAGEAAWLYHLNNILLHALNSVLVALLVWRLLRDRLTALLTGALFAVHPLHVESVAWISERKDVLCVCFYLLALLAHVRWQAHGRWRSYLLVQLCGVLALLAKPLAMTLPAVLLLCDVYTHRLHPPSPAGSGINFKLFPLRWWRWLGLIAEEGTQPSAPGARPQCARRGVRWGVVLEKAPLALAALVITLLNVYQQHAHGAFIARHARSVFVNVLMACYGVCLYVIKTVLPVRLSPVYLQPQEVYLTDGITVLAVLVTCAVVVLAVAAWRRERAAGFALAFFCITLVPNSQLVPTGLNIFAADRFYYLPGIGLLYLLAHALRQGLRLPRWRALVAGGIAVFLALLAWRTWTYTVVWQTDQSLWEYTLRLLPEFRVAKGNLALAYQKRGERERAMALYHEIIAREHDAIATANLAMEYYKGGDATQALRYAELSLRGRTNLYQGLFVRAAARGVFGDVSNALQDLQQVLALEPLFAEAQMHLAQFHLRAGDTSSATRVLARYLALEKQDMGRAYQLASLYEEQRALRDAREWYQYVARHARHHVAWYRCGLLSLKLGEFETARAALERAVQLAPDYAAAWADLAVAHRELGQTARALELSAHAEALAPQSPKVLYDRSCILATSGQTAEALRLLEQAIERAPELRASAKIDPDYAALRHLPAFQQLVTE